MKRHCPLVDEAGIKQYKTARGPRSSVETLDSDSRLNQVRRPRWTCRTIQTEKKQVTQRLEPCFKLWINKCTFLCNCMLFFSNFFFKTNMTRKEETLTPEWDGHFLFKQRNKKDVRVFIGVFPFIVFFFFF